MTQYNGHFRHVPRRVDNSNDPSPLPEIFISYEVIPAIDLPAIQNQLNTVVAQLNALNIVVAQDNGDDGDGDDGGGNDDDDEIGQDDPAAEVEDQEDYVVAELNEGADDDGQENSIVVEVNVGKEAEEPQQD
ncbi:MAG: hypothetical protein J3R72DRAFT_489300 [Linnemannia gamsii]|nr:MAG: hypothetical protein J3R72DRAFT_489300 [Linnemannia gamsii]